MWCRLRYRALVVAWSWRNWCSSSKWQIFCVSQLVWNIVLCEWLKMSLVKNHLLKNLGPVVQNDTVSAYMIHHFSTQIMLLCPCVCCNLQVKESFCPRINQSLWLAKLLMSWNLCHLKGCQNWLVGLNFQRPCHSDEKIYILLCLVQFTFGWSLTPRGQ